jgi:hypothetical protein
MNCFNVREIQTLVRARYHPSKVESKVTNEFVAELLLLLRHRFGDIDCLETTKALYSQFGMFDGKLNSEALFLFPYRVRATIPYSSILFSFSTQALQFYRSLYLRLKSLMRLFTLFFISYRIPL